MSAFADTKKLRQRRTVLRYSSCDVSAKADIGCPLGGWLRIHSLKHPTPTPEKSIAAFALTHNAKFWQRAMAKLC